MAGKNFFVFDHSLKRLIQRKCKELKLDSRCYTPIVDENTYKAFINFRFRKRIESPVLCVVGTTNKQGKFTTQLRIKEILNNAGYKISHLSTEPHGELFGADLVV